jgi:hypothetical protein
MRHFLYYWNGAEEARYLLGLGSSSGVWEKAEAERAEGALCGVKFKAGRKLPLEPATWLSHSA